MGRTLTFFVAFIAIVIVQVKSTDSENANASGSWLERLVSVFWPDSSSSKSLKVSDIGSNWVYLEGRKTGVQCINESSKSDSEPWSVDISRVIHLTFNHTYTCTIEDSGVTFTLGAGNVTSFEPGNGTVIGHFEGEGESCEFICEVQNHNIKTDTMWSLERNGELQMVNNNHLFDISGNNHPKHESTYGSHLKIRNCSSEDLNGTVLYCGSHLNHTQVLFELKICEKPNVTVDEEIWLEEGTIDYSVTAISWKSSLTASNLIWQKDNKVTIQHSFSVEGAIITFKNVTRKDIGMYSVTADVSCYNSSNSKEIVGNFSLNVLYGPELKKADEAYSALEGQSVKLICGYDLDSNPTAIISWANPKGETVMSSEKFAMNNGSEEVSLKIANVSKDDNGTWTCTVKVPRNKPLHCSSEQERLYLEYRHLQLMVVSPPSEPKNLRVVEVTSSSFCIRWDKPDYLGFPYLAGYVISYNDKHERIGVIDSFSFGSDHFEEGQIYDITVSATSESGNEIARGNPSTKLTLMMDRPGRLRVADISSSQVTLTWDKLSGADQLYIYSVTCNGTAQGPPTTKNSYVISELSQSLVYNCTVVGISKAGFNSLRSFEVLFVPGAGDVTDSAPDNRVIARFEDEEGTCDLTCVVKYNGTQTDTVWSLVNFMEESEHQTVTEDETFTISGDRHLEFMSKSNYGNHLKIRNCSSIMLHVNGRKVYCGSHLNHTQVLFEIKICEKPNVTVDEEIWLEEGTIDCSVTAISWKSSLTASNLIWQKDNEEVITQHSFSVEGAIITCTFKNATRKDTGMYSVAADVSCHNSSNSREIVGNFSLNVLYGPELKKADEAYSALEGHSVKLICGYDLDSNPIAIISWANSKGETVMSSEKFAMNNGSEEVSLKIANVNKDDNGTWTCTVKVPRNKALHCSSEEERSYLEHCHLQLIVVSPPSEPQNLRVVEITSSSFRIRWDKPDYLGSPYLAGYIISYNDKHERIGVVDSFSFGSDHFEEGQIYDITISAISESGNEIARGNPSTKLTLMMDRPGRLRIADISSSQVTLTWDKLSGALPQDHLYSVTCYNGTTQGPPTTENSCVISELSQSLVYNCTVVGISEADFNSLRSFEVLFVPGAGDITDSAPDNRVIARFEDEEGTCDLTCVVKYNGTQTDTVWSLVNFMEESEHQTVTEDETFTISGDRHLEFMSKSNYGNHLKIRNCSSIMLHVNGRKVYCGSHLNRTQVLFELKICEKPNVTVNEEIWLEEGTIDCSVTAISWKSSLTASNLIWQKDNEEVTTQHSFSVEGAIITFKNVTRNDTGMYSVAADVSCHNSSNSRKIVGNFSLNVLYGPELKKADETYCALEGHSVKLICGYDLDSNPTAIISWANPKGETVMSSEKFAMNDGSEEVSLKIANVSKDDNGTWMCTVKVPRNKPLHCSSEEERSYLEYCHLQLIVVSPPSEPQNLRVVEVTSSSFRICWDKLDYLGSPYLAGYVISYNDRHERIGVVDSFSFGSDRFEEGQIYNITVSAISESGNESARGNSSIKLTLMMDRPGRLRVTDIRSSQVTLTWDKLSGALPQDHLYSIICNGTAQGPPTTENSYVISELSQSLIYNCTVVGISEAGFNSLRSFEVLFVPGAGNVTSTDPDETIIAHFEDEGGSCNFTCKVKNNGTQTDAEWSFKNGSAESKEITGGHISGDYRPGSQSHYSNHLQIMDCSLLELDGVTVFCGSHVSPKQAYFELKVCELPHQITPSVIQVIEGTEHCPISVVSTNLTANNIRWEKDGKRVWKGGDNFTIMFNNVTREDTGSYSVTSSIVCHDKTKPITEHFALDVVFPPTMRQGEGNHKVNETCTVTLICGRDLQSNPRANITWIDPDGNEVVNKENYSQDDGPGVIQLHIKRVNRRDRGQWTCKRDFNVCVYDCSGDEKLLNGNQDGQQPQTECSRKSFTNTSVINLDVFYGPDIKSENLTLQSSVMNETKTIVCARGLESNPPATIGWINPDGDIIENGNGYSYQSPLSGSKDVTLTITSVSEKDNGTWTCTIAVKDGENEIGRKVIPIELNVDGIGHTIVSRWMFVIVGTTFLGIIIIIIIQRLRPRVAKASKPTAPKSEESEITKPQTSDKITAKPCASPISHSCVTSTQESHDDGVEGDIRDPILTKTKLGDEVQKDKSLAETLRSLSKRIYSAGSHPDIYCPIMMKLDGAVTKCIVTVDIDKSIDEFRTPINEKVLMLVGPTGAGKSTLINGIANYIMGVYWQNNFRFKVIVDEGEMSQAHSQTSNITAYTFHNSRLPYTLTVIDTPGFGDTRGIESDKIIVEQIRALFSVGGIDQIHGVGFVTDASSARLTPTVQYVFDSILSIFGKDIASNIFLLLTFSDGQEPPVLSAIKEAAIPYKADFKFNNSALFVKCSTGTFDEMFWGLGMENFNKFFREFESVEPHSLHLTRENLNERQQLEAVIEGLKMQIRVILAKIDVLRQKQYILRKREAEILQNQHFTYEVTVSKQRQIELPKNVFVTNCHQCQFTCHYPCPVSKDNEKYRCKAMDGGGPDSAHCTVCPGNCPWSQHANATYRFESYYEVETQTSDDLRKNLFEAIEGKSQIESVIADIEKELEMFQGVIVGMVSEAKQSLERLQDIALKPNPLSEIEYIDLLIKAENSEKNPGFTERIKAFEMIKNIVKTQGAVARGKKTDSMWWKSILARK